MKKIIFRIFLCIAAISCTEYNNSFEDKNTVCVMISFKNHQNFTENGRSAHPDFSNIHLKYDIFAEKDGTKITGKNEGIGNIYMLALTGGIWNITVNAYNLSDRTKTILFTGTKTVNIIPAVSNNNIIIPLHSVHDMPGTGKIDLKIKLTKGISIKKIKYSFINKNGHPSFSGTSKTALKTIAVDTPISEEGKIINIKADRVNAGSYGLSILFYEDSLGKNIVYSINTALTVFPKCITSVWKNEIEIDTDGVLVITDKNIEKYKTTAIFVSGSDLGELKKMGNDITGNGSYLAPFASLDRALNYLKAINTGSNSYTVYVDGKINGKTNINSQGKILSLEICGLNSSKTDILNGNNKSNVLSISDQNVNLSLKNIKITGGKKDLCIKYGAGKLFLKGDTEIEGNILFEQNALKLFIENLSALHTAYIEFSPSSTYKKNQVILEPSGNQQKISFEDINRFKIKNNLYVLASSGNNAVLSNTSAAPGVLSSYEMDFILEKDTFIINKIKDSININNIKLNIKKDGIPENNISIENIKLMLYLQNELITEKEITNKQNIFLSATNIYPGVFTLKMQIIIDGMIYSSQKLVTVKKI